MAGLSNSGRMVVWGGAVAMLVLPAIAMEMGAEVDWTAGDFAVAALLLATGCAGLEWLFAGQDRHRRAGIVVGAATPLLLVFVNGAVGIVGETGNPANGMFLVIIGFALAGALLVRFRTGGLMAVALICAGLTVAVLLLAQFGRGAAVPAVAYVLTAPWLVSALLLHRAQSREGAPRRMAP